MIIDGLSNQKCNFYARAYIVLCIFANILLCTFTLFQQTGTSGDAVLDDLPHCVCLFLPISSFNRLFDVTVADWR